jgi:hypothetical protein
MTREQFEKAESIAEQYDIVQKQMEVTKSIKSELLQYLIDSKTVSREEYDKVSDDLKELCLAVLLDNTSGATILADSLTSLELSLTRQCVSLADEFNNL